MKVTVNTVIEKLSEYGFGLFTDYPTEDQGYCFVTKGMIIFLDEDDDSIAITFQADSKPEDVASNLLIINEIEDVTEISIMESFIYDKDNKFISGNKAHDIVKGDIILKAFKELAKQQTYTEILKNVEGYNC